MAFPRAFGDRPESLVFRGPQSPREESASSIYTSPLSPIRTTKANGAFPTASELRGSLQRRFTTNALPTLSPIGQQRRQAAEQQRENNNMVRDIPFGIVVEIVGRSGIPIPLSRAGTLLGHSELACNGRLTSRPYTTRVRSRMRWNGPRPTWLLCVHSGLVADMHHLGLWQDYPGKIDVSLCGINCHGG